MNWFERWILKRIFRKMVTQGAFHQRRIEYLYKMIREACEDEFTEETEPSLDAFLFECFETSNAHSLHLNAIKKTENTKVRHNTAGPKPA